MSGNWKPDAKVTGLRLAIARRVKGYSQKKLADMVPAPTGDGTMPQTTYSNYETGRFMPSITTLDDLANALDVDFLWLLGHPAGEGLGPKGL